MIEIDERLGIAVVYDNYDKALKELKNHGFRPIFLAENARLRIQEGRYSDISRYGNRVREDILYVPGKGAFLTKVPLMLAEPEKATEAHMDCKEFYLTDKKEVEWTLEDSVQLLYDTKAIPTNRFNENEITVYAFGITYRNDIGQAEKDAQEYGDFLRNAGVKMMAIGLFPQVHINSHKMPFARKLWFDGLAYGTGLSCDHKGLSVTKRMRGVRKKEVVTEKPKPKKKLIYINPFEVEWED